MSLGDPACLTSIDPGKIGQLQQKLKVHCQYTDIQLRKLSVQYSIPIRDSNHFSPNQNALPFSAVMMFCLVTGRASSQ